MSQVPSHQYRDYLRGVRMFLTPDHEAMLQGDQINNMRMDDLEALFTLVMETEPRKPSNYHTRRHRLRVYQTF